MSLKKSIKSYFLTGILQLFNFSITLIFFTIGAVYLLIADFDKNVMPLLTIYFLTIIFSVFCVFISLKCWFTFLTDERTTEKRKRELQIGLGGIIFFGIIPKLAIHFNNGRSYVIQFLLLLKTCNIISLLFYMFVYENSKYFELEYKKNRAIVIMGILLHLLILAVEITKISLKHEDIFQLILTIIVQIYYSFFTLSAIDMVIVWKNGIKSRSTGRWFSKNRRESPTTITQTSHGSLIAEPNLGGGTVTGSTVTQPTAPLEEMVELNSKTSPECKICMLEYSNQVIPRNFDCGHTVCEGCVNNLLKQNSNGKYYVLCPFCRKTVFVPGGLASQLPKNFAILELVQENK